MRLQCGHVDPESVARSSLASFKTAIRSVHVGFLVDQLANLLPVSTLLALPANRGHVFAPLLSKISSL